MNHLRSFSVYGFTLFFNAAVSFAGFALLTHYLHEVDYGIISLYSSFTVFLTPFIAIGTPFSLSVDYFKMDGNAYRDKFTNSLAIPVTSTILFTILMVVFYPLAHRLLKVNAFFVIALPFTCLMVVLNEVFLFLFRNKAQHFLFAGYSIGKNLLEVGLSLLLIISAGYTWQGRLSSSLISLLAGTFVIAVLIYRWRLFTGQFSKQAILSVLLGGLPFILERLSIFVLGYSDRFFIDHYASTAEVGYYGAGAQIALIVNLAILTLNNTFYPSIYRKLSESPIDYNSVWKIVGLFIGVSFFIALVVIASTPLFFRYIIGPAFLPGKKFAVYLTIGFFFWSIYNVLIAFLLNLKKNKTIMLISVLGMALSLLLNFINVRYFGAMGAAYTSMTVYCFMALITYFFVRKFYDSKIQNGPVVAETQTVENAAV